VKTVNSADYSFTGFNMSTSSEKDTSTTGSTQPGFAPQVGALTTAFNGAQDAYGKASQAVAPTDFTAQLDPAAIAAFQQMIAQGGNLSVPNTMANTGTTLQNAGTSGVTGALSGLSGYNPAATNNTQSQVDAANQYVAGQNIPAQVKAAMQGATETARDVTMPGIEQNAAIGNNTNSTRTGIADGLVQRGLAEQSANLNGSLSGTAFANGLNLAQTTANNNNTENLGALSTAGNIGNTAANTGVNAGNASVADQGALSSEAAAGGAGLTAAQQAILNNEQQQYQSKVTSPFAAAQGLMSVAGTNNWGQNTTGTSDTTSTPSAWDTISGLMSSGGKLASGIGSMAPLLALSDRRYKEDITRIGTAYNGLPLYTFRYIGDPEKRLNIGVMAQDVELVNPDAVIEHNGIKIVDYSKALSSSATQLGFTPYEMAQC
jgi:hypothetical protein